MSSLYRYRTPREALIALKWREPSDVKSMAAEELRNTLVVEIGSRLGLRPRLLQAMLTPRCVVYIYIYISFHRMTEFLTKVML
jgi:hypothetical protein